MQMPEKVTQNEGKLSVSEEITAALKEDGKFTYYQGMSFEMHRDSHMTTKYAFQELAYRYDTQEEKIEHAFIIAAVIKLGTATRPMILDYLRWQKRCYPKKKVPLCGADELANDKMLAAILKKLCRNGLLIAHDYVARGNERNYVIIVYTGTMYGHTMYRNVLEEYMEFDMNSMFRADIASFRLLATNAVAFRFCDRTGTTGIFVNGRYGMEKPYKKLKNNVFGLVTLKDNDKKQVFIIEPMFFRFNPDVRTEQQVEEQVEDRFDKLLRVMAQIKELDEEEPLIRMIYVVENMEGLGRLRNYIGDEVNADLFRNALFTSENVVYKQGGNLDSSFLQLQINRDTGKTQFRPALSEWWKCPSQ
jgi:hypothetical protein